VNPCCKIILKASQLQLLCPKSAKEAVLSASWGQKETETELCRLSFGKQNAGGLAFG
jgi:hypothetical protein